MAQRFSSKVMWFQTNHLSRMKESTQNTMQHHLAKYLIPKWGNYQLRAITSDRVNEWLGEDDVSHLSPRTLKHLVATLSMVIGKRFGRGEIHYPSQREELKETRCFEPDEMSRIISEETDSMYRVLYALAAETGARAGELYGLEVTDIDFQRNFIKIRRSAYEGKIQSPKSQNAYRVIDVQPWVLELVKRYLRGRTSGLVVRTKNNQPLRHSNVLRRYFHPLLRRLGIEQAGLHAFRHGRVSYLIEQDTPVDMIKAWIGHGSEKMIAHYTHRRPKYRSAVLAKVAPLGTLGVTEGQAA
jgi:integrase